MNPDAEDRSIEMDDQDLNDSPSDNPGSPPPDVHTPSAAPSTAPGSDKKAVVRGARACTVCRTAKMRCIGGDDQNSEQYPCNRCKKANVQCVFEKHRRGRKPGSKLSEATKARRASKEAAKAAAAATAAGGTSGPSSAGASTRPVNTLPKLEEQNEFMELDNSEHQPPPPPPTAPLNSGRPRSFSTKEKPGPVPYHTHSSNGSVPSSAGPHALSPTGPPTVTFPGPYAPQYMPDVGARAPPSANSPLSPTRPDNLSRKGSTVSGDDEDSRSDENLFPGSMVQKEKNKFLSINGILNPDDSGSNPRGGNPNRSSQERSKTSALWTQDPVWEPPAIPSLPKAFDPPKEILRDPLELKLINEQEAEYLLAKVIQHLNPFVNLFDEKLHTVQYIRARSSFLFTVLMMAGCKFWKPELFRILQKMAYVFASRALVEQWKGVEIVQAFACMVYWKEPEDNRNWTYIGHACRMAVELRLNTYIHMNNLKEETELQWRERRNRERTYYVLWVHDRSLSMQTGRPWMLQEDELIRNSMSWHNPPQGLRGNRVRREDVIVAAFVQLRRLSAETSDVFYLRRNASRDSSDVNYEVLLMGCNRKLTDWIEYWEGEMQIAGGGEFHDFILRFFRLHVRLFLNSLGLTASSNQVATYFSLQSLTLCYTSAKETLEIVTQFARLGVLKYGQEVITVMSAYAAIFLLKLLRRTGRQVSAGLNPEEVHSLIKQAAIAFYAAGDSNSPSMSAKAHARFMNSLVDNRILQEHASESQLGSEHIPHDAGGLIRQPMALPSQPEQLHMYNARQQRQQQSVSSPASTMGSQQIGPYSGTPPANVNVETAGMMHQQGPQQMMHGMMDGSNSVGGQMYYAHPPQQQQPPPPPQPPQQRRPTISQAPSSYAQDPNMGTPPSSNHPAPHHPVGHLRMNSTSGVVNGYPNPANGGGGGVNIPPPTQQQHYQPQQAVYGPHQMGVPFGGDQQQQQQQAVPSQQQQQYQAEQMIMPLGPGDPQLDPMYTRHILDQLGMPDVVFQPGYPAVAEQFGVPGDHNPNMYR